MSAVDHVRFEQLEVGHIGIATFEFAHILDLLEFLHHEWRFSVPFSVDEGEDIVAVFPTVLAGEPSKQVSLSSEGFLVGTPYLGDSGRKKRPMNKPIAGSIWRAHGILNAAGPST